MAILELSSWQLQAFATKKISVNFACVTNLYPDHLNTYKNVTEYYQDKTNIFKYQTKSDHLCLLKKQPEFSSWADQAAGRVHLFDESILPPGVTLKVPGLHNRRNAAAAFCLATCFGIPASVCVDSLNNFEGVPYRLQTVAIKNQITFVNDTTATTPVATITALTTLSSPLIAIIGGHDKNLPLEELAHTLNQKAEACVLLKGSGTQRLKKLLNPQKILLETNNFKAAVLAATGAAKTGETVLLSPAFASFGMFKNEFDRGQQFNEIVTNL